MPVLRVFRPVAGHRRAVPTIGTASRHHGAARTGVVPRSPGPWQFSTFLFLRSPWGSVWPGRSLIIRSAANDRLSSTIGVMSATGPPAASRPTYDVIRGIDAAWRKPFLIRSPLSPKQGGRRVQVNTYRVLTVSRACPRERAATPGRRRRTRKRAHNR